MKRIAWILGAATLAVVVLLMLLVALLPRDALKTRVGEQIAAWTGRDVSLRGAPELDIFPSLTVTLKDVQVGGPAGMPDGAIISMERLRSTIRVLPLIIGRVEIGSFTMVRPLIRLIRDEEGARNWAFDSGAAALQLAFAGDVPLGDFVLEDGTLVYENRQGGVKEQLDSVNLKIDWPSVRQPLAVTGSGIWRGEEVS
ncbi:MAG: AsmA family protein, partial [Rhizobiales bacterium]|nr:AsmA family protein [Hyphomicrobiales bacterium]